MKKVGVLGSGTVGQVLADGFLKHGYAVMRGSRDPQKLADWKAGAGANASTGTFAETAKYGDVIVLAVKGGVAEACVEQAGAENLAGKTVLDADLAVHQRDQFLADRQPKPGSAEAPCQPTVHLFELRKN